MVVTLLGALTVISTKSLGVGIILLVLTIGKQLPAFVICAELINENISQVN